MSSSSGGDAFGGFTFAFALDDIFNLVAGSPIKNWLRSVLLRILKRT
jgi:hypothetical protein